MFEWTLSIGTLLTVVTIIFTAASVYWKFEYNSSEVKADIQDIKADLKQLNKVIIDLALQSHRIDMIEKTLYDLRHGKGIVND